MSTEISNPDNNSVFGDPYYKDVQNDIWETERVKSRNSIWIIGGILFASDLIGLSMAHALSGNTLIYVLVFPIIYLGLGFFSKTKPLIAITIATILFAGILILNLYYFGAKSILSGLLMKAVVVFLLISGFRHAREAESARNNLKIVG